MTVDLLSGAWDTRYRVYVRAEIESLAEEYEAANRRKLVKDKKDWLERKVAERKEVRKVSPGEAADFAPHSLPCSTLVSARSG